MLKKYLINFNYFVCITYLITFSFVACKSQVKISVSRTNTPDTNNETTDIDKTDTNIAIPSTVSNFKYKSLTAISVKLEWDDLNNEDGYVIQRASLSNEKCANYSKVYQSSQNITSWTDSGLSPQSKYCYRIYAYNKAGNGPYSNEIKITTLSLNINLVDNLNTNPLNTTTQPKSFYDELYKIYWIFYYDGTQIQYKYNIGNNAWNVAGTLGYNTSDFSLFYKIINNVAYVVLSIKKGNDIVFRKGIINNTSINFDDEIIVFDANSSENYALSSIIVDKQNYAWVASGFYNTSGYYVKVKKTNNTIVENTLEWANEYTLNSIHASSISEVKLIPPLGSKIYLICNIDNATVGYVYDGSSWNEITNTPYKGWVDIGGGGINMYPNAIVKIGSDIYVGGEFWEQGGVKFGYIIKWDGFKWNSFPNSPNKNIKTLYYHSHDKHLYVGGEFNLPYSRIMKWNGKEWLPLANGVNNTVNAIVGIGSEIYIGGAFTSSGYSDANYIAKWDGSNWKKLHLTEEPNSVVNALAVYGTNLYIGGSFTTIGTTNINRIAKWNGSSWQALGTGTEINNTVNTIGIVDENNIYIGGTFTNKVMKWNGTAWQSIGNINNNVNKICIQDSTNIYIGGAFTTAGSSAKYVVKYNGTTFESMGGGVGYWVQALYCDDSKVYIGGRFIVAYSPTDIRADHVVVWDTQNNTYLPIGASGLTDIIKAISVTTENKIHVGGYIYLIGDQGARHFGVLDPNNGWFVPTANETKVNNYIFALNYLNDNAIYAGGTFNSASNLAVNYIAKWNGSAWEPVQAGSNPGLNNSVNAIMVKSQNEIYVGGAFTSDKANTVLLKYVSKFNGTSWEALGTNPYVGVNNTVYALANDDQYLYVGGSFTSAADNQIFAPYVARYNFNGNTWTSVGDIALNGTVRALVMDGSDLYVGGDFTSAGSIALNYIAKWSLTEGWQNLGEGLNDFVRAIAIKNGKIYVAGGFSSSGGKVLNKIAFWDGSKWNSLSGGVLGAINSIAFDSSNNLIVGGNGDLKIYKNSLAPNAQYGISAISDKDDNLYLLHVGFDSKLYLSKYTSSGWENTQIVSNNSSSTPFITISSDSKYLFNFWSENGAIKFRKYTIGVGFDDTINIYSTTKSFVPLGMLHITSAIFNILWISVTNDDQIPLDNYSLYQTFIY